MNTKTQLSNLKNQAIKASMQFISSDIEKLNSQLSALYKNSLEMKMEYEVTNNYNECATVYGMITDIAIHTNRLAKYAGIEYTKLSQEQKEGIYDCINELDALEVDTTCSSIIKMLSFAESSKMIKGFKDKKPYYECLSNFIAFLFAMNEPLADHICMLHESEMKEAA